MSRLQIGSDDRNQHQEAQRINRINPSIPGRAITDKAASIPLRRSVTQAKEKSRENEERTNRKVTTLNDVLEDERKRMHPGIQKHSGTCQVMNDDPESKNKA